MPIQKLLSQINPNIKLKFDHVSKFKGLDLQDLCDSLEQTFKNSESFNIGFMSNETLPREKLEKYFEGVLLVPERELFVGRIDGTIAGSIQLLKPPPSNKTQAFAVNVENHFVAPWARGHGLARVLLMEAEKYAKKKGFSLIKLSVRANSEAAINLYESAGYKRWGQLDKFEKVGDKFITGNFYYKEI